MTTVRLEIGGGSFSCFATLAPSKSTGPQSWYGDSVSNGSATETRYGTALPVASSAEFVRPPEVEKKSVSATLLFQSTTWLFVAVIASLAA